MIKLRRETVVACLRRVRAGRKVFLTFNRQGCPVPPCLLIKNEKPQVLRWHSCCDGLT